MPRIRKALNSVQDEVIAVPGAAYRVVIDRVGLADGGGYVATVPELPGVMADGRTREEAARNVERAIRVWIETAEALGQPVPAPLARMKDQSAAGEEGVSVGRRTAGAG
jgi:predicted RNase H-like HicB family nuclease